MSLSQHDEAPQKDMGPIPKVTCSHKVNVGLSGREGHPSRSFGVRRSGAKD